MIARSGGMRLDELAERAFQLIVHLLLELPRNRRRSGGDLKDLEFLTLAVLHQQQPMIVGDIQRILGVLPPQMSRLIRSLEGRPAPLVVCQINPQDKRKIDVFLTPAGEKALADYQTRQIESLSEFLRRFAEDDQDDLARLLDKLHGVLDRGD